MGIGEAIVLGITQGLTEFLPISSDGHLAVAFKLLGESFNLSFVIFLHFATLLAIIAYFWRDLLKLAACLLPANRDRTADRRLVALIAIGTAVSAVLALGLKPMIERASESNVAIGLGFLLTTALLVAGEMATSRRRRRGQADLTAPSDAEPAVEGAASGLPLWKALPIGVLQGLAALPGVSRSGSTIAGGMLSGLPREDAARFSFLLGVPIITLATVYDGLDLVKGDASLAGIGTAALIAGFLAALIAGYAAIWGLLALVKRTTLYWFAAYTGVLGTVILVLGLSGRG